MADIQELKVKYADILDLLNGEDIRTGNGWYEIIDDCLQELSVLKHDMPDTYQYLKVRQIKEKFGTLRIYVDHGPDNLIDDIIGYAIDRSTTTCESCGSLHGKIRAFSGSSNVLAR